MLKRVKSVVAKWVRAHRERNDPEHRYLAEAVDLVDLEHRMQALRHGSVRLYTVRGFH